MATADPSTIKPAFSASDAPEPPSVAALVSALSLIKHIEGGYFAETDRDPSVVPSPFPPDPASPETLRLAGPQRPGFRPGLRNFSTSIHYLLTPSSPQGHFHRNRARTVHTLHRGRGTYVLVHEGGRVETFDVGDDVAAGEKLQWVVEGGVWKASFLLPDRGGDGTTSGGLLISETVVPGFEYCDHEFLTLEGLKKEVGEDVAKGLEWLVRIRE